MKSWDLAGQAIEGMVEEEHPESVNNWSAIVPMDDVAGWGLNLARWATEARTIVANFQELIGKSIDVPDVAIENAGSLPLDKFQAYLASKADYGAIRAAYYKHKALHAEWEK